MKKFYTVAGLIILSVFVFIISGCEESGPEPFELEPFVYHEVDTSGEPVFFGSWENYTIGGFGTCGFGIDELGFVHLKGIATHPTYDGSEQTIFNLPPGYRPSTDLMFFVFSQGTDGFGLLYINFNGDVVLDDDDYSVPAVVSLDGISFFVGH